MPNLKNADLLTRLRTFRRDLAEKMQSPNMRSHFDFRYSLGLECKVKDASVKYAEYRNELHLDNDFEVHLKSVILSEVPRLLDLVEIEIAKKAIVEVEREIDHSSGMVKDLTSLKEEIVLILGPGDKI